MITPEALNEQVDRLLELGNIPRFSDRCNQIEADTLHRLNSTQAAIRDNLSTHQQQLRADVQRVFQKQSQYYERMQRWSQKSSEFCQQLLSEQKQLEQKAAQLRAVAESHGQQLAVADQQRQLALQNEIVQLLTACKRQVLHVAEQSQQQQQQQQQGQNNMQHQQQQHGGGGGGEGFARW